MLLCNRCAAPAKLPTGLGPQPGMPPLKSGGSSRDRLPSHRVSAFTVRVVVFQVRLLSHFGYTSGVKAHSPTRVKLNRVFFPR